MALLLAWLTPQLDWLALRETPLLRAGAALGLVGASGAIYGGLLLAMGVRPRDFRRRET
jgi:putative peptidoglycan lipid II flippase